MDRKQRVYSYIISENYIPVKLQELRIILDVPKESFEEFDAIINELKNEGKILFSKKDRILPVSKDNNHKTGVLKCNQSGKFGFVIVEDADDVYISSRDMGNALDGDKVLIKLKSSNGNRQEGTVVKIIERTKKTIVGVVESAKKAYLVVLPDDKRIFGKILISNNVSMGASVGKRVAVDSIRVMPDGRIYGSVCAILGDENDLSGLIDAILIENNIKCQFDNETLEEANNIDEKIIWDKDDRVDLRDKTIFTIDGELARDFDDAVSIEMTDEGVYKLGVHIADVSEYVKEGNALDREAFSRGTSVYLPDRVIPMLPEKLSNGVCSLNPSVDRLTLSVDMDIDVNGNVISHSIYKSVICSKERLTYTDINNILENEDPVLSKKYSHILTDLQTMWSLSKILRKKRLEKGAVDFDFPESEIVTDEDGFPCEVRPVIRGASNKMIEEFMLIANETVAEYAFWSEIPCVFRSHEAPSMEKLSTFISFLKPFGLTIKGKIDEDNPVKPKAFEQILKKVKGTSIERVVSKTMLRSLMKADYKAENTGHFGLASKYYCHFTSPIRRYPDLVVHRSLKRFIDGKSPLDNSFVVAAAKNSSEKEVSAEMSERDSDDLMKTAYLSNFIGCDFEGVVSGVTSFGMFVELQNGIEGLVRLENMTDDYYEVNEQEQCIFGERTNIKYTVGDNVSVFVAACDVISRKIDFVLSKDVSRTLLDKFNKRDKRRYR